MLNNAHEPFPRAVRLVFVGFLAIALAGAAGAAIAAEGTDSLFVQRTSSESFNQTVDSLKHAVSSNGMMSWGCSTRRMRSP
jgi:hypothetical protein